MNAKSFEPAYLQLFRSDELQERAGRLMSRLASCDLCPRICQADRLTGNECFCHSGSRPVISSCCAHHGEEPALSGTRGSGTIFFGNCTMRCVYCQNYQISQHPAAQRPNEVDCHALAADMLYLQNRLGCHNINLVSPTHFVPQIVQALVEAVPMGLRLPLVYNTSGYECIDVLKELDGIIDIYLPDIRYASDKWAVKFSQAPAYVANNRAAIKEMQRQAGDLVTDEDGIAQRGLIVRHLILPNGLAGSRESLSWLATEVSPTVTVSIMSQYYPTHRAPGVPLLSRTILRLEYDEVVELVNALDLENGWIQDLGAAGNYLPDFNREGHPFKAGMTDLPPGY